MTKNRASSQIGADFGEKWTEVVQRYPEVNFLQSPEYGRMNELLGCRVVLEDFSGKAWALMIVRDAKRGRYLEIPCGPLMDWGDAGLMREVFHGITEVAEREKCGFVRVRPQLTLSDANLKMLEGLGLKKSPMHLAAEHTVMIDLLKSEEELLAGMRRQTRYEVRRAEKLGLSVSCGNDEGIFREFHRCQMETAKRQNFVPPTLEVLMAEKEAFGEKIKIYKVVTPGELNGAPSKIPQTGVDGAKGAPADFPQNTSAGGSGQGEPVAYGLIIGSGKEADYYEAASTLLNRKLPGAYALLWRAMRDLKAEGYERFNLWGIAPPGQPNHRYAGVTTFKTGFGGEIAEFVPAHDLVISRLKYVKNLTVETVRKKRRHL